MGSVVIAAHSDFEAVDCRTRDSKTRVRTYDGQNSSTSVAIENFNCRDRKKWLTPDILQPYPVLQRVVPAFDLGLRLRMIRRAANRAHLVVCEPVSEVARDRDGKGSMIFPAHSSKNCRLRNLLDTVKRFKVAVRSSPLGKARSLTIRAENGISKSLTRTCRAASWPAASTDCSCTSWWTYSSKERRRSPATSVSGWLQSAHNASSRVTGNDSVG